MAGRCHLILVHTYEAEVRGPLGYRGPLLFHLMFSYGGKHFPKTK